jgi:hypothetical protein
MSGRAGLAIALAVSDQSVLARRVSRHSTQDDVVMECWARRKTKSADDSVHAFPPFHALIGGARLYGGHFLESNRIVNGNSRRSETIPENDQPFPELGLSSVREFPGSIQCIPDIWLRGFGRTEG